MLSRFAHQIDHLRVAFAVVISLDKDQSLTTGFCGVIKFQFGRGFACFVFPPVLISKNGKVNVATGNFAQIDIVGFTITGGYVLEKENIGYEATEQRVMQDKFFDSASFHCQFFLNAADKNAILVGIRFLHLKFLFETECPLRMSSESATSILATVFICIP